MPVSQEEHVLVSSSISHICQELTRQFFSRSEVVCEPEHFSQAESLLFSQGVVNLSDEPSYGVWENSADPEHLHLSLTLLRLIGRSNAALGLSMHRNALVKQLVVDFQDHQRFSLCLHGHQGIGRHALCSWWQQGFIDPLLIDCFDNQQRRLSIGASGSPIVYPVFSADTSNPSGLCWWIAPPPSGKSPGMGLDELCYSYFTPESGQPLPSQSIPSRHFWHQEWLGLLAIQLGCVDAAEQRASQYANLRYQGGALIRQHAAVQALLNDIHLAQRQTSQFLHTQSLEADAFGSLLLARNHLQQLLSVAINAAMQILGGVGYMQDSGIEKLLRDCTQLRLQSGGPLDMQSLAATWETT